MALKERTVNSIYAEYVTGIVTLEKIARSHRVSKRTVIRLAQKYQWERGERQENVTPAIGAHAEEKIIKREGDKLFDATGVYLDNIKIVDRAIKYNLTSFFKAIKEHGSDLPKHVGDRLKSAQQFLECCAKTYKINLEGRRLALGLDKDQPTDTPVVNINIGKTDNLSLLEDNELDVIVSELN